MRMGEIVLIVALVAGMFLVLAFGFGTNKTEDTVGDVAVSSAACGMEDMAGEAGKDCGGGGCADCEADSDPILAAFVDFSQDGEYTLTGASLKNTGSNLELFNAEGTQIAAFNIDSEGAMVPTATQPDGNVIKSAYSGPPGDSYTKYKIYPASYTTDKSAAPLMAVDHSNGSISITPANEIRRQNSKSYLSTAGSGDVLEKSGSN